MKQAVITGIFCIFLMCGGLAQAQTATPPSEKYQQMLVTSPELKEADQAIKDTLAEAKTTLTPSDFKDIEKIHANWVKNEFTKNVKAYMAEKLSEPEAWAMEIGGHADNLSKAVEILRLRREGTGNEGVYEFQRGSGPQQVHGIMLIKKVEDAYTVNIEVTTGKPGAINVSDAAVCIYSGEGTLGNNTLTAVTEDSPEATLSVFFEGKKAIVRAGEAANEQCGKGVSLDNIYNK